MSLLKQIDDKGALLSWSPLKSHPNLVALGTKDSAGIGFDDHGGELELHLLDFSNATNYNTTLIGKSRVGSRFSSLAWSPMNNYADMFHQGVIAGGMVDGTINIWDPSKLSLSEENGLLASLEQHHQGSIPGLHFNPHKESSHLLASGGSDGEIYVTSLERLDTPTVTVPAPAPANAKHTADVTAVAWNTQVVHILASAAQNGSCIVWDLRQKRAWCELRDPSGGTVSDIAWNPDQGLHLITASGEDRNPVLKLWDLRSSTSLPLATLQGHTEGILSISWCPSDPSFLMSCGKDSKTILWDLFHLQPAYELPFKGADTSRTFGGGGIGGGSDMMSGGVGGNQNNAFGSLATNASHRRYHVSWSPVLPAVASASSFDRKVQFFSLTGARSKIGRAPKWLRKPVGTCFGFGGKLVTIDNTQQSAATASSATGTNTASSSSKKTGGQFGRLKLYQVSENPELTISSDHFHECFTKGQYKEYCELKSIDKQTGLSNPVWSLMKMICFGAKPREELLTFLGFDGNVINQTAQVYLASKLGITGTLSGAASTIVSATATTEAAATLPNISQLSYTTNSDVNAADIFGGGNINHDHNDNSDVFSSVPLTPVPPTPASTAVAAAVLSASSPVPPPVPTTSSSQAQAQAAPLTEAQEKKLAELLQIVRNGEEAEPSILQAIIVGDFELAVDICLSAGLLAEALLLCQCGGPKLTARTQEAFFAKQRSKYHFLNVLHAVIKNQLMEFVQRCDLLQWKETMAMLSTYAKSEEFSGLCEALASRLEVELNDRPSATLCYMCATNVPRVVQFWTEELIEANKRLGQIDTLALQDYVEKILIFTQANPVEKLPVQCGEYFAKYAELLANQGRLLSAMTYLKSDALPITILVDRLYHAGNKPAGSRPPPFPFSKVQVDGNPIAANNPQAVLGSSAIGGNSKGGRDSFGGLAATGRATSSSTTNAGISNNNNPAAAAAPGAAQSRAFNRADSGYGAASNMAGGMQPQPSAVSSGGYNQTQQQQQQAAAPTPLATTATPALPAGWVQLLDPNSNMYYYVNQATGQSQWEPPVAVPQQPQPQWSQPEPVAVGAYTQQQQQPAAIQSTMAAAASAFPPSTQMQQPVAAAAVAQPTSVPAVEVASESKYQATPETDCVVAIGQLVEAIAASTSLSPTEKKQIGMLRQGYQVLFDKLKTNELTPEILLKLSNLVDCIMNRNFPGATAIQTDLVTTAWDKHKEWIKGIKILIQLAAKK